VDREKHMAILNRLLEMQFVAIELNLYLDTHPCDQEALNDYNCAVEILRQLKREYEECHGPLFHFGWSLNRGDEWQWAEEPWPWEM